MSKAKKAEEPPAQKSLAASVYHWFATAMGRRLAGAAMALAVMIALGVSGWNKWGPTITNGPSYKLDESKFEVTPQPTYIHANVKRDALRAGGLVELSILDPKLTEKVQHAFAVHTWVASVTRITKHHPARVVVELEYRQPAGMVEIAQGDERGLLPVDRTGVLLPPEDFSANQVRNFLRISVGPTTPEGPVGTPWGDKRIEAAAQIASALEPVWQKLQLYRIVHTNIDAAGLPSFDIVTRDGAKVIWGHAPGQESSGEATASEKVAQLTLWHEKNGPLTTSGGKSELNVRDGQRAGTAASQAKFKKT